MKTTSLLLCLLVLAAVASATPDYPVPAPGSYALPVIKRAADGVVLDAHGNLTSLAALTRGRITVMSFIYTQCASPNACPSATGVLWQLSRESAAEPELAAALRLVSMSFDPLNDTPDRMLAYSALVAEDSHAAPWHFVTTRSERELRPILAAYDQAVSKKANPRDPTGPLNHTLRVFLVDAAGNIRNIYSSGTLDVRLILADVRTLMLEAQSPGLVAGRAMAAPASDGN